MNPKLFTSACILAGGLLVKFGAPLPAVAAGMALAAIWNFKRGAVARRLVRPRG